MSSIIIQDQDSPTIEIREGSASLIIETTGGSGGGGGGSGNVSSVGTPTLNQVAVWNTASAIRGTPVCEINDTTGSVSVRLGASNDAIVNWTNESGNARGTFGATTSHLELGTDLARLQSQTDTYAEAGNNAVVCRTATTAGVVRAQLGASIVADFTTGLAGPEILLPTASSHIRFASTGAVIEFTQGAAQVWSDDFALYDTAGAAEYLGISGSGGTVTFAGATMQFGPDGSPALQVDSTGLTAINAQGPQVSNAAPSNTVPTLIPRRASATTGIGSISANNISVITSSIERMRIDNGGGTQFFGSFVRIVGNISGAFGINPVKLGATGAPSIVTTGSDAYVGSELEVETGVYVPTLKLQGLTTTERNALSPSDGWLIYNTTDSKAQIRAGGAWVDLH